MLDTKTKLIYIFNTDEKIANTNNTSTLSCVMLKKGHSLKMSDYFPTSYVKGLL